jgi:hypothetical protein
MDIGTIANIATTVAVIVGIVLGLAEVRRSNRARRDQASMEIVRAVQGQEIADAAARILALPIDADPALVNDDPELLHAATLVHFAAEMFGTFVFEGVVDQDMLDRSNGGWIRSCWLRLRRWIEAQRAAEQRVNVGEWWQWLYERLEASPEPSKALGAHVFYRGRRRP